MPLLAAHPSLKSINPILPCFQNYSFPALEATAEPNQGQASEGYSLKTRWFGAFLTKLWNPGFQADDRGWSLGDHIGSKQFVELKSPGSIYLNR